MVVLLLPLSLAIDNGAAAKMAVNNGSGSGGGVCGSGGSGIQWRSMAVAAFDGGNATTSRCVVSGSDIVLGDVKKLRGLETFNASLDVWAVRYCFIELSQLIVCAVSWLE